MSLKTVHIVFITSAILLTIGFGWWSVKHSENMCLGIGSFAAGGILIYYLFWFLKKIENLNGGT